VPGGLHLWWKRPPGMIAPFPTGTPPAVAARPHEATSATASTFVSPLPWW